MHKIVVKKAINQFSNKKMIVCTILVVKLSKMRYNDSIQWSISAHVIEEYFIIATYVVYYYLQLLLILPRSYFQYAHQRLKYRSTKLLKGRRVELLKPTKLINYDQCCGENDIFSRSSFRWLVIARADPVYNIINYFHRPTFHFNELGGFLQSLFLRFLNL